MKIYRFDLATRRIATMDPPAGYAVPPVFVGLTFTSRLYPVEVEESVDTASWLLAIQMMTPPSDNVDASAQLSAGVLRAILLSHTQPPESVDAAQAQLIDGILRTILLSHAQPPESVEAAQAQLISGQLRLALITTVMVPEGIDAAQATLIAGTLT